MQYLGVFVDDYLFNRTHLGQRNKNVALNNILAN